MRNSIRIAAAGTLGFVLASGAWAQDDNIEAMPGFFDFGSIPGVASEPKVQIDLNPVLLGFVREASKEAESDAGNALAGLKSVRVSVYEAVENQDAVMDYIGETSQQMESEGWQRVIYVEEQGEERVRMYMKSQGNRVAGLTMMVAGGGDDEAVFINIVGDIDPAQLGKLAGSLGAGGLLDGLSQAKLALDNEDG